MKGLLKEAGLEKTKICKSTKTREGCGAEKSIEEFGISSTNKNTGVIYRKNICIKCEYRDKKIVQPIRSKNTDLIDVENIMSMAWR